MYDYYLGNYKYKVATGKVYKKVFWFFYKKVSDRVYKKYIDGVKAVNELCGIEE